MCLPGKLPSGPQNLFSIAGSNNCFDSNQYMKQQQQQPQEIPSSASVKRSAASTASASTSESSRRRGNGNDDNLNLNLNRRRKQGYQAGHDGNQGDTERHFVQHDYHDHSKDSDSVYLEQPIVTKGGVSIPFPMKLHNMLNHIALHENELSDIVSWQPHGRCFCVKKIKEFTEDVLPRFFQQRKYPSFQRQLNLYGFNRITAGPDKGSYYHELFLRSKKALCRAIHRMKVKGTGCRMASNPRQEPNFYAMEPMPPVARNGEPRAQDVDPSAAEIITPPSAAIKAEEDARNQIPEMPPLQLPLSLPSVASETSVASVASEAALPVVSSAPIKVNDVQVPMPMDMGMGMDMDKQNQQSPIMEEDPSDDLRFVFGGMPFHSLNPPSSSNTNTNTNTNTNPTPLNAGSSSRRSSFLVPLSSGDNGINGINGTNSRRNSYSYNYSLPDGSRRNSFLVPLSSSDGSSASPSPILQEFEDFEKELNYIADLGSYGDLTDSDMSDILDRIVCDGIWI